LQQVACQSIDFRYHPVYHFVIVPKSIDCPCSNQIFFFWIMLFAVAGCYHPQLPCCGETGSRFGAVGDNTLSAGRHQRRRKAQQIPKVTIHTPLKPEYSCAIAGYSAGTKWACLPIGMADARNHSTQRRGGAEKYRYPAVAGCYHPQLPCCGETGSRFGAVGDNPPIRRHAPSAAESTANTQGKIPYPAETRIQLRHCRL
jgi:hypothetical protein